MGASLFGEKRFDVRYVLPLEPSVLVVGNSEAVEVR